MICPPSARAWIRRRRTIAGDEKLASGRGNLLAQAEAFRGLGVEVKRGINPDLVEQATAQDEQYRLEDEDNLPENDEFSPDSAEALRNREAAPPR